CPSRGRSDDGECAERGADELPNGSTRFHAIEKPMRRTSFVAKAVMHATVGRIGCVPGASRKGAFSSVRIPAAAAAIPLALAPAALADTPTTLHAEGSGSVMVTPDQASLSVTVSRSASQPAPALSAVNARLHAIVAAVRALGVPASGIQTEQVNVYR